MDHSKEDANKRVAHNSMIFSGTVSLGLYFIWVGMGGNVLVGGGLALIIWVFLWMVLFAAAMEK